MESATTPEPTQPLLQRAARTVKTLRWWALIPVPILILVLRGFVAPDSWREPLTWLFWMSSSMVCAAFAHGMRRILLPWLDMSELYGRAKEGNVAASVVIFAGMVFTAWAFSAMLSFAKAQDVRTFVPPGAVALLPELRRQQLGYWPDHPAPSYFGALIEHESCISLTHSRCWNPKARLKTDREEGASLGQFTRAWRPDGSLRFDAIAEVRALDPTALAEFSWATVYSRADLSMRAILVKVRDCDRRLQMQRAGATPLDRVAFCDYAYNGGGGAMASDRQLCKAQPGCDPQRWFGNVERFSLKSRQPLAPGYGGRSAFQISREHVQDVVLRRRPKYVPYLGADVA